MIIKWLRVYIKLKRIIKGDYYWLLRVIKSSRYRQTKTIIMRFISD